MAARTLRPDLWKRVDAVARIIDPAAFMDDWIVEPESAAKLHKARLGVQRANATARAHRILEYLGVNTSTDWHQIMAWLCTLPGSAPANPAASAKAEAEEA
jgi:hypothetical protein